MSTRPALRAFMSRSTSLARCTVERQLRSTRRSSCERSVPSAPSANAPPTPMPALSASASTGRPVSTMRAYSASTPSGTARSTCTGSAPSSAATAWIASSSAATIRSKPVAWNWRASSSPIPLEAPVTTAKGRWGEASMQCAFPPPQRCKRSPGAHVFERPLERLHEVLGGRRLLARCGHLDLAPLALGVDDLLQPRPVAVVVALGVPVGRKLLDHRHGAVDLFLGRLLAAGGNRLDGPHFVGEAHGRERQSPVAHAHQRQVLLGAHHEPAEGGAIGLAHRLDKQAVCAQRALALAGGHEPVRVVEVERVDVAEVDEGLDVDRARLARLDGGELLVGDHHLLAFEVLLRAVAALLDRHLVLVVDLAEVVVEVALCGDELDRHIDQPEAQRPAPQRACHQRPAPRLASSAAARLSPCSGSSCSARSISSPLALRLMRSRTASR